MDGNANQMNENGKYKPMNKQILSLTQHAKSAFDCFPGKVVFEHKKCVDS